MSENRDSSALIDPLVIKIRKSGPLLMVSLFLLLLSFFILLISISQISQTRSVEVLKAVSTTFQRSVVDELARTLLITTLGEVPQADTTIEDIETLWTTEMPVVDVDKLERGTALEISFTASDLFVGGSTKLRADREPFLKNLASALRANMQTLDMTAYIIGSIIDLENIQTAQVEPPSREQLNNIRQRVLELSRQNMDIYDPANFAPIYTERIDLEDIYYNSGESLGLGRAVSLARYLAADGVPSYRIKPSLRQIPANLFVIRFIVDKPPTAIVTLNEDTEYAENRRSRSNL